MTPTATAPRLVLPSHRACVARLLEWCGQTIGRGQGDLARSGKATWRMDAGRAQMEWIRQGGGFRRVPGVREAEMVILPDGDPLAIIPAGYDETQTEAACEALLGRLWLARYGNPDAREHLRAWLRRESAA